MGFLTRTSAHDTWPEFESAAEQRYWDALTLAAGFEPRLTGAVYLFGYVAEMLLKASYFRLRGVGHAESIQQELAGMAARSAALGFAWKGNRHNLDSLCRLVVEEHRARGAPLPAAFAGSLLLHVLTVAAHWSEWLRYKDLTASPAELSDLFQSIEWVWTRRARL